MTDAAARIVDLKKGLKAVHEDVAKRLMRDGSNLTDAEAQALGRRLGAGGGLDQGAADERYRRRTQAVPLADVAGLKDALGGKQDKLGFTPADAVDTYTKGEVDAAFDALPDLGADHSSDIAQLALSVAELRGSLLSMAAGVADSFDTQTGVDSGASAGVTWSPGRYGVADGDAFARPNFTAPTTGGWTVSASHEQAGFPAWYAVNASLTDYWYTGTVAGPWWLKFVPDAPVKLSSYTVQAVPAGNGTNGSPAAWKLQGSDDGVAWVDVDIQSGQIWTQNSPAEIKSFTVANPGLYGQYRLLISAAQSATTYTAIANLTLAGSYAGASAIDLISTAFNARSAPSKAMLTILARATEPLGGSITGQVSRDNGVTWTDATLTSLNALSGYTVFEARGIDLSDQPSGTAMRWRVQSSAAGFEAAGVILQWSGN